MKKTTLFQFLLQSILTEKEVFQVSEQIGYQETARKFTAYNLLIYWTQAAFEQWDSSGVFCKEKRYV